MRPSITLKPLNIQQKPTCRYCLRELDVPENLVARVREHRPIALPLLRTGFYLSPERQFYCNKGCYGMFNES